MIAIGAFVAGLVIGGGIAVLVMAMVWIDKEDHDEE